MKAIEVYAGVGGIGIGLEAAGIQVVSGYEFDPKINSIRRDNGIVGWHYDAKDISRIAPLVALSNFDMICGGPPLNTYSPADARQDLILSFALLIGCARPQWFLFENVRDIAKSEEYQRARKLWKRYGYGLTELVVNAAYYGVSQSRKRFICVGRLGERDGFLESAIRDAATEKPQPLTDILDPSDPDDAKLIEIGGYFTKPR